MEISICRACGTELSSDGICEALEKYLEIYSQLTAIQLEDEMDLRELKICIPCVDKLQDFDQFRKLCLQVHWRLSNVKTRKKRAKYGSVKSEKPKSPLPIYSCDRCPKKFRVILRMEAHKRTHDGLKPFECDLCGKDFCKWNNLKTHHIQKHTDQKISIPCGFEGCDQTFATQQGKKRHYLRTHDPTYVIPEQTAFVCDTCGKTFTTNGALKKHKFIHTPNDMPFVCGLCGKKFPTSHKLKEHTWRHQGIKNHTCSYCGLRKTTMHELKTHINTVHSKTKTFPCDICASEFTNIGNLNRHVRIVHLGMKPYVCHVCDKAFGKGDHLKRHMKSHNLPPSSALPAPRIPRVPPVYADPEELVKPEACASEQS
ncbi:hypothetical protein RP20_CCG020068 [Aedes albopictus]|nr:hypothetical protein RP20_CCG020068 [Aedes albopictus]